MTIFQCQLYQFDERRCMFETSKLLTYDWHMPVSEKKITERERDKERERDRYKGRMINYV